MRPFLLCAGHDFVRLEANSLINHPHSAVPGTHGHLFGAIRVPIETRLSNKEGDGCSEALAERVYFGAYRFPFPGCDARGPGLCR